MKRFLFGFLAVLFLILNKIPYLHILADDMPTNSQYEMLGAYALSTLITSGEATELDFSDYTENDTSFLIDLGEAIFTGDWSGLAEDGLEWLGETADNIYDSYKEYVSQWKSVHLGIMYSHWFPDETIYVGPDDSYSLAKPLRELFTPRGDSPSPTPTPDPDYVWYINQINSNTNSINSFYWRDYPQLAQFQGGYNYQSVIYPFYNYSWFAPSNSSQMVAISIQTNDCNVTCGDIIDIYIYSNNNNYSYNVTVHPIGNICYQTWNYVYNNNILPRFNVNNNEYYVGGNTSMPTSLSHSFSGSLLGCFQDILTYFRNVNIYVDGDPWSLVGNNEPTYPIVIPGQLTIYNNQPLEYSFPIDTHIKLPDLTNIIRNAINSSGVVMWSDIADVFVDVNGQTAVAVTKIVRNDYDNLYNEQYPYPAMLVGMTDQTKFNEHLLDNSHAYLSPMGTVVQETVNVLPAELVGVLAIGAILTIFAVILNRLLE